MSELHVLFISRKPEFYEKVQGAVAGDFWRFTYCRPENLEDLFKKRNQAHDLVILEDYDSRGETSEIDGFQWVRRFRLKKNDVMILPIVNPEHRVGIGYLEAGCSAYLSVPLDDERHFMRELKIRLRWAVQQFSVRSRDPIPDPVEILLSTKISIDDPPRDLRMVLNSFMDSIQSLGFKRVRLYLRSEDEASMLGIALRGMEDVHFVGSETRLSEDPCFEGLMKQGKPKIYDESEGWRTRYGTGRWGCVPLFVNGKFVGKLEVDSKSDGSTLVEKDLEPVNLLAKGVAIELIKARSLFLADIRARKLAALLDKTLPNITDLEHNEFLVATCKAAYDMLGAGHVGIAAVLPNQGRAEVVAEYPTERAGHVVVHLTGPLAERLVKERKPIIVKNVRTERALGRARQKILGLDIHSFMAVPVCKGDEILAVMVLCHLRKGIQFSEEVDVLVAVALARNLSTTMENHRLYHQAEARAEQLHGLRKVAIAVTSPMGRKEMLDSLVKEAVELLHGQSGGIHLYLRDQGILKNIADFRRHNHVGVTFKVGTGLAGRLVLSGEPFIITSNYDQEPEALGTRPNKAMVLVPLKWRGDVLGVLYVDDYSGRLFSKDDADLLALFADHVVIALKNEEHRREARERADYFERLTYSTHDAVIAVNMEGEIQHFNRRAQEMLGYTEAEAKQKTIFKMYPKGEPHNIGSRLYKEERVLNHPTHLVTKSGETLPVLMNVTWIYNAMKERIGSLGVFEHLVEQDAKARLETLEKVLALGTEVSHLLPVLYEVSEMALDGCKVDWCFVVIMDQDMRKSMETAFHGRGYQTSHAFEEEYLTWTASLLQKWQTNPFRHETSSHRHSGKAFDRVTSKLKASRALREMVAFPVVYGNARFGVIWMGRHGGKSTRAFAGHHLNLGELIADKTASLMHRYVRQIRKDYQQTLMGKLQNMAQMLAVEKDTGSSPVKAALELLGYQHGILAVIKENIHHLDVIDATPGLGVRHGKRVAYSDKTIPGLVAMDGRCRAVMPSDFSESEFKQAFPEGMWGQTVLTVRLKRRVGQNLLLMVSGKQVRTGFVEADLGALEQLAILFADRMSTVKMMGQMRYLNRIDRHIQRADDLDDILFAVLTGVTAGVGLGFNRAVLYKMDETRGQLSAIAAVGEMNVKGASDAWDRTFEKGINTLEKALEEKPAETWTGTALGRNREKLAVSLVENHLFSAILEDEKPVIGHQGLINNLPGPFKKLMNPGPEFAIIPLTARRGVIGLLYVDNCFTRNAIDENTMTYLVGFAETGAIAIEKDRLRGEKDAYSKLLKEAFDVGHLMVADQESDLVFQQVTEKIQELAGADGAGLALKNQSDRVCLNNISASAAHQALVGIEITDDVSLQVIRENCMVHTDGAALSLNHPMLQASSIQSAVCLPLHLRGEVIGILWFWYSKPISMAPYVMDTLNLLLNQAAVVYDNFCQIQESNAMAEIAKAFAETHDLADLQKLILDGLQHFLGARTLVLWRHDSAGNRLMPKWVTVLGDGLINRETLEKNAPVSSGPLMDLCPEIWNLVDPNEVTSVPFAEQCLATLGTEHLLVLAMKVRGKNAPVEQVLAMIYVIFDEQRVFTEHDRSIIETFLRQAAVAYWKTLLMHQSKFATKALKGVEAITKSNKASEEGDHWYVQEVLDVTARQTHEFLQCDSVVLYEFDTDAGDVIRCAVAGVGKEKVETTIKQSKLLQAIERRTCKDLDLIQVEDVTEDVIFKESPFVREHLINSCLVVPLGRPAKRVGWMFVNFTSPHRFVNSEVEYIELFATSVSETLLDAQLFKSTSQRAETFEKLNQAGRAITGILEREAMLKELASQAWRVNGFDNGKKAAVDVLWVEKDGRLSTVSCWPDSLETSFAKKYGDRFTVQKGLGNRGGIVGLAFQSKETQVVSDVRELKEIYLEVHPWVRSKMVIPIKVEKKIIALIDLVHEDVNHFRPRHKMAMEVFTSQVIVALENIKNLELNKQLNFAKGSKFGMEWMQMFQRTLVHGIRNDGGALERNLLLLKNHMKRSGYPLNDPRPLNSLSNIIDQIKNQPFPENIGDSTVYSFNKIVGEIFKELKRSYAYSDAKFDLFLAKGPYQNAMISINKYWLSQLLKILSDNAVRAIRDHHIHDGHVLWRLTAGKDEVHIRVEDNGGGVPKDIQDLLFENPIPEEDASGSGNGLYIASTICKSYESFIQLDDSGSKKGNTVFQVTFKTVSESDSTESKGDIKNDDTDTLSQKGRSTMRRPKSNLILLVDDHDPFLESQADLLRDAGYYITTANTVQKAVRAIESHDFSLAIIDVRLNNNQDPNDFSGFAVATHPEARGIPKILWSQTNVHTSNLKEWYGREVRMEDLRIQLVSKSISQDDLQTIINQLLEANDGNDGEG